MYIDTHCHVLNEYYDDIEMVISECRNNDIEKIIVNGCDINSNREVLELVSKYDIVYGAIGFHPTELHNFKEEYFKFLEDNIMIILIKKNRFIFLRNNLILLVNIINLLLFIVEIVFKIHIIY